MNINIGFEFVITKNCYTGSIIGFTKDQFNNKVAIVMFFDIKGYIYKICDVYVQTIKNNLKLGTYKEINSKEM